MIVFLETSTTSALLFLSTFFFLFFFFWLCHINSPNQMSGDPLLSSPLSETLHSTLGVLCAHGQNLSTGGLTEEWSGRASSSLTKGPTGSVSTGFCFELINFSRKELPNF